MILIKNKYRFIGSIASVLLLAMSSTVAYADDRVSFDAVKIESNKAYTAEEVIKAAEGQYVFDDNSVNSADWVWMTVTTKDFMDAKTGTEFMNKLYPSGLRLPTMLIDPSDAVYRASDYSPIDFSDGAKLLRCLNKDRVNYTSAEIEAANKYYRMIQAKSIALGLPVFSFDEEFAPNYSKDVIKQFQIAVKNFESIFGTIGFPDTRDCKFDWNAMVKTNYGIDTSSMVITDVSLLEYRIPKGSKTISLYQAALEAEPFMDGFKCYSPNDEQMNVPESIASYSYDVQEAYKFACDYLGYIASKYDTFYSTISVGDSNIHSLMEYFEASKQKSNSSIKEEKEDSGGKYANDDYVIALQNQRKPVFSNEMLAELESDAPDLGSVIMPVLTITVVIIALIYAVVKFVSFISKR